MEILQTTDWKISIMVRGEKTSLMSIGKENDGESYQLMMCKKFVSVCIAE
nr:MAG TPA: hypothetical protein [Caudoviricetes sp.]